MQSIRARAALDNRISTISVKSIVTSTTTKLVSTSLASKNIIIRPTCEYVVCSTTTKVSRRS